jgi:Rrf2 family protein
VLSLTRKSDYALVALTYLGRRRQEGAKPVSARQIAETFGLPLSLLMNILKELGQAKIVSSTRGVNGGYELTADPGRVSLLEVVTAIEGPTRFAPCTDGLPIVGQGCRLAEGCPIRDPIRRLHNRINGFLEETTLLDLLDGGGEEPCVAGAGGSAREGGVSRRSGRKAARAG